MFFYILMADYKISPQIFLIVVFLYKFYIFEIYNLSKYGIFD
jgi:hypothetical protein